MKLVSYKTDETEHLGIFINGHIYNLHSCDHQIPDDMHSFLKNAEVTMERAQAIDAKIKSADISPREEAFYEIIAPVPHPASCRDGYAFREHVETARRNLGMQMNPEYDQFPVFYFTNHHAIDGPGEIECMPDHFYGLDFELEVAVAIGKKGKNITAAEADSYIAGFMIMNDLSARVLQMEEMQSNLGPAKGKDFSTVLGPWLVTPDELEQYKVETKAGHTGNTYNLNMSCTVNGKQVSAGNMADMNWTFAEIIERCAYGAHVFPGDVIGSGTVGTGCFLELNGTGRASNPDYQQQWLKDGDVVELEVTGLGILSNTIRKSDSNFSILALKK
jgi:fumarylacetoacetate (FAA) hydrolase